MNVPLYLIVKTVMMIRSVRAYRNYSPEFRTEEQLNIKELSDKLEYKYVYLIFPSQHKQFRMFPSVVTRYSAIIAIYNKNEKYFTDSAYDTPSQLTNFYTLDFEGQDIEKHLTLTNHLAWKEKIEQPVFYDNTSELLVVIDGLLQLMREQQLEGNGWFGRLECSRRLLVDRDDGLHILHQAGFYDHESLYMLLKASVSECSKLDTLMTTYTDALAVFAMFVVNGVYKMNY